MVLEVPKMAITWEKRVKDPETGQSVWVPKEGGPTHVGLVMGEPTTNTEQVMSDIYAPVTRVQVWNPRARRPENIALQYHFECGSERGTSTVDIDPKILKDWRDEKESRDLAEQKRREKEREEKLIQEAKDWCLEPRKGRRVLVFKGRKVPVGTSGLLFWEGDGRYGPRVGILDDQGNKHYTSRGNVHALITGLPFGQDPECGWVELKERILRAEEEWHESFPKRGDAVRLLKSGVYGEVSWAKGPRLGVTRDGALKDEEPIWCNAWEVALCAEGGRVAERKPKPVAVKPVGGHPMDDLPEPLCRIREVGYEEASGKWKAYDEKLRTVMIVPKSTAYELLAKLEGRA